MNKTTKIKDARYIGYKNTIKGTFGEVGGEWFFSTARNKIRIFYIPISENIMSSHVLTKFEKGGYQEDNSKIFKYIRGFIYYKSSDRRESALSGYMKIINKEDFLEFMLSF